MKGKISKWGNSLGIRLPYLVVRELGLTAGKEVEIERTSEGILIKSRIMYTLDELLEGVTPENVHPEMDWGPDVGAEIWEY